MCTPRHPGEVFSTHFLEPQHMSLAEAAAAMGLSVEQLTAVVTAGAPVTEEIAAALGAFTRTPPTFWLRLQHLFEAGASGLPGATAG